MCLLNNAVAGVLGRQTICVFWIMRCWCFRRTSNMCLLNTVAADVSCNTSNGCLLLVFYVRLAISEYYWSSNGYLLNFAVNGASSNTSCISFASVIFEISNIRLSLAFNVRLTMYKFSWCFIWEQQCLSFANYCPF